MHLNQIRGLRPHALFALLSVSSIAAHTRDFHPRHTCFTEVFVPVENGDEKIVQSLFTRRTQMEASMAYETSFFKDLVARQKSDNKKLEFQDDIKKLNEELARIEGEKAKGDNPKLIEKEKKLLNEKAHCEIQDAAVLSYYTQSEYDRLTIKVSEAYASNKARIESRSMIHDEIQYLFAQSEEQMKNAAKIMASGYSMKEEIDRANNGRLSFAMEALGIEQLNQILEIIGQLDMLLTYSNDQLLEMKTGQSAGAGVGTITVYEKPEETIEVTLSEPALEVVKVEESLELKSSEPIPAIAKVEEQAVAKSENPATEVKASVKEEPKPIAIRKEVKSPVKKNAEGISKSEVNCQSVRETEGTFFTVQIGSFNKELSNLSAYRKLSNVFLDNSDGAHYRYTTGQFTNLDEAFDFVQSLHTQGFPDAFVTAISAGQRTTIQHAKGLLAETTR